MKVSLLSTDILSYNTGLMALQLIGSVLKKNGIEYQYDYLNYDSFDECDKTSGSNNDHKNVSLYYLQKLDPDLFDKIKNKVNEIIEKSDLVLMGITHLIISSSQCHYLLRDLLIIQKIKEKHPQVKVILGGLNTYHFDIQCDADTIINTSNPDVIIDYLNTPGIFIDKSFASFCSLDQEITCPKYEASKKFFALSTAIGCHNRCDFCTSYKSGTKFQYFSVEYLLSKAKQIKDYGYQSIYYCGDSISCMGGENIKNLFEELSKIQVQSEGLVNFIDYHLYGDDVYKLIGEARFVPWIGIESGSEQLRNKMNRPKYTNEQVLEMVRYHVKYNIPATMAFFSGHIYETNEDFDQTIKLFSKICELYGKTQNFIQFCLSDFILCEDSIIGKKYPDLQRGNNFTCGESTPEVRKKRFKILIETAKKYMSLYENINAGSNYIPHCFWDK